jgi:hypothetical protein
VSTEPESEPEPKPRRDREANLAFGASNDLDRAVRDDLNAIMGDSLLTLRDAADEITRAIEQADVAPLALAEIRDTIDRLSSQTDSPFAELESLLAAPATNGLALERGLLAELLTEGAEGQQILKRGLLFCKHRRYPEAIEWWRLQRRGLDPRTSRLHLLLLIMESLTHLWASDPRQAEFVRNQVKAHPLFKTVRGQQTEP